MAMANTLVAGLLVHQYKVYIKSFIQINKVSYYFSIDIHRVYTCCNQAAQSLRGIVSFP